MSRYHSASRMAWSWDGERLNDALFVLRAVVDEFDGADHTKKQAWPEMYTLHDWATQVLSGGAPGLPARVERQDAVLAFRQRRT